jgi:hypothetical protein
VHTSGPPRRRRIWHQGFSTHLNGGDGELRGAVDGGTPVPAA